MDLTLTTRIDTTRSGSLPFSATWREDGWELDLLHHKRGTRPDGSADGIGSGLDGLLSNESSQMPNRAADVLETLWNDIKNGVVSPEAAQRRFNSLGNWISDTTKANPGDKSLYYDK